MKTTVSVVDDLCTFSGLVFYKLKNVFSCL